MLNRKGLLLVVSGPSGAGKGTICKALLNKNDQIKLSVSATTRKPRNGEVHGVNYFFIEKEEFTKMIENGEFLEYAQIYDNFYGTPKAAIIECLEKGQDVILEIEMQGARQIKEVYPEGVFIFVLPPSLEELKSNICCLFYLILHLLMALTFYNSSLNLSIMLFLYLVTLFFSAHIIASTSLTDFSISSLTIK